MVKNIKLEYQGQQVYRAEAEAELIISGKFGFKGYGRTTEGNYIFYSSSQSNLTIIKGIGEADGYRLKAEINVPKNETFEAKQIANGLAEIGFVEKAGLLQSAGRGMVKYALAPASYAADVFLSAIDQLTERKVKLSELERDDKRSDKISYEISHKISDEGSEDRLKTFEGVKPSGSNPARLLLPSSWQPHSDNYSAPSVGKGEPELEQKAAGLELAPFPDQPDLDKLITAAAIPNNVSHVGLAQLARVEFYDLAATALTPDQWKTEVLSAGSISDRV
jgi:hypothetical protein